MSKIPFVYNDEKQACVSFSTIAEMLGFNVVIIFFLPIKVYISNKRNAVDMV